MEQWCGIVGTGLLCGGILTGSVGVFLAGLILIGVWWWNKGPGGP
jgi:hypothetical protein